MKKKEAVALLNEIMKICILPRYVALERSSPESQSYELRIGNNFDTKTWNCLKEIIIKEKLSMKETGDYVTCYTPEVEKELLKHSNNI
jgi:hypothetical protein